ncbi:GtrA family protein [Agromyces sp. LHK192]|uniref:GtrA family protein n=1 Tax=Agromyces sp. LHK192 TaxID=2498704 RepID=UPI000FDB38A6|nr:GtrA family protein [Agromyces sp. LHK192]
MTGGSTVDGEIEQAPRPSWTSRLLGLYRDERVRFVMVGGANTAIGYGLFLLFEFTTGPYLGYFFSLYASFFVASIVAFILHRHYTFKVNGTGNVLVDFVRFLSVYVVSLGLNTVALPICVELLGLEPWLAQAIIVVVTTLVSYFGHKYFSFRRKA